ncbi:hypothetical protein ERJ75_000112300 [Trypanosoma vivax]|nr:hypothetical protein ERJ75_001065100 [Trypanosoma vivax]KAH8619959.1 hypothetical protein ERJ75_000112100 [Trypanosoma vivax]KAH8619962.1 hypothetical protein ERJ75_000112500 [Trypanosoma vivax]KAH8619971.1 hypothetical protein ERJ75_000112300 [Trypanosoma vivax]
MLHQCISARDHPYLSSAHDHNYVDFMLSLRAAKGSKSVLDLPPHVSGECRDLLGLMLHWDRDLRPAARKLLQHRWFAGASIASAEQELHHILA